jgi:hypothetical protein
MDKYNIGFSYKGEGYILNGTEVWFFDPQQDKWTMFEQNEIPSQPYFAIVGNEGVYLGGEYFFFLFIPE